METKTDRELIQQVDNKVDRLADSVDRFIEVVKNIEEIRLASIEKRLSDLEKFKNQWGGALIAFNIVIAAAAILIAIYRK